MSTPAGIDFLGRVTHVCSDATRAHPVGRQLAAVDSHKAHTLEATNSAIAITRDLRRRPPPFESSYGEVETAPLGRGQIGSGASFRPENTAAIRRRP
jgi:hypothetical protein